MQGIPIQIFAEAPDGQAPPEFTFDVRTSKPMLVSVQGRPLFWSCTATAHYGQTIDSMFPTPSAAAMHYRLAWRSARDASLLRGKIRWTAPEEYVKPNGRPSARRQVLAGDAELLFDFFEYSMSAAMSAYAAIEAFCNQTISDKATIPIRVKRRRPGSGREETVGLSIEEAERQLTTEEKLKKVVPECLGQRSPAGDARVWPAYRLLKDVRDSVTHFKRKDQVRTETEDPSEQTALQKMVDTEPYEYAEAALAVISHFETPENSIRWLRADYAQRAG